MNKTTLDKPEQVLMRINLLLQGYKFAHPVRDDEDEPMTIDLRNALDMLARIEELTNTYFDEIESRGA